MKTNDQAATGSGQSPGRLITARWLSPRRKRFWAIVLFLAYTLFGFFAVPHLLDKAVRGLLQEDLGRGTSIANIDFNPYAPSLRIQGFQLLDSDGTRIAAFDELYVNFQWASILKWAWTFSDVSVSDPYLHFERFEDGGTRIGRLLDDFAALDPADPHAESGTPGKLPRLLFRNLVIQNGTLDAVDRVPARPVETRLTPINISLRELSTIPDQHGQKAITIELPGGASVQWSGSLALTPLLASGELALQGLQVEPFAAYLQSVLPLDSVSAVLSTRFEYRLSQSGNGAFDLDLDNLEITLDDILVSGLQPATEFIDIRALALDEGKFRLAERSLHFGKLEVSEPRLSAWIGEDGALSLLELIPAAVENETGDATQAESALPWHLGIGEIALDAGQLAFSDRSILPAAEIMLTGLKARVSGFNNEAGVSMPFDFAGNLDAGGSFSLAGEFSVLPGFTLTGTAVTEGIALSAAEAYAQQFAHVAIEGGVLDSQLELGLAANGAFKASGSLGIAGLAVNDTLKSGSLLAWKRLDIDRFDLDDTRLHISQLDFEQPYGRLVIFEDMSTNVASLVKPQAGNSALEEGGAPMGITIGGIRLAGGAMDFADLSLPLPFAAHITKLGGTVSTIATGSAEPANIRLEGQVDEFGLARFDGSLNVFDPVRHTDITVEFRNLLMSTLSPYTVAFAGRKIDQGKLDLGLVYRIEQGRLHGENDIVLSDLVLGEKVDHPDAASLPLGLAVSLLKDADGVIKIDLPVEGDVNDPEFRIGGVVWQAFTGLITKIVSAPFRLLGNLIGIDSEDLGEFRFLAGRFDLTPPELEKIAQLEQALAKRPELAIEINGVANPAIDAPAISRMRLLDAVGERMQGEPGDQQDEAMMLDEEFRAALESLFTERFPTMPPASLKPLHTSPPAGDPEGKPVLDKLAYAADLWARLLATESVSPDDLAALAIARAETIRNAFLANGSVAASRILMETIKETDEQEGEWVILPLAVKTE